MQEFDPGEETMLDKLDDCGGCDGEGCAGCDWTGKNMEPDEENLEHGYENLEETSED